MKKERSRKHTRQNTRNKKSPVASQTVNLLDLAESELSSSMELVRLGSDEIALVPFTDKTTPVTLHFCDEREISGYVICGGEECLLCRIGRKKAEKYLLPVYVPAEQRVRVLPVSSSLRPFSLLAQLRPILKSESPMVVFISREGMKYTVTTRELLPDIDAGDEHIRQFMKDFAEGGVDLSSVFLRMDNSQLAMIGEIERMMKLKGIDCSEDPRA